MRERVICFLLLISLDALALTATSGSIPGRRSEVDAQRSLAALVATLDRYHTSFNVYTGAFAAGNHFDARARLTNLASTDSGTKAGASIGQGPSPLDEALPPMNEAAACPDRSGTCIQAFFRPSDKLKDLKWGGWYFLNGVLFDHVTKLPCAVEPKSGVPSLNLGICPDAGVDLRGARVLSLMAKGHHGGERVTFLALGAGHDPDTGRRLDAYPGFEAYKYPDSSSRAAVDVTLTTTWQPVTIDLRGRDLHYVLGGFGWVAAADRNGHRPVEFYMTEVQYDLPRLSQPRLPLSFETVDTRTEPFDTTMRNVAFTYDAAVAAIALTTAGDLAHAKVIVDALREVQDHDRFYTDDRLRNAYMAGDLILPPGWIPNGRAGTARVPGWEGVDPTTKELVWQEDRFDVSTHTGNLAWAMLAWLTYYEATSHTLSAAQRQPYLDAAIKLGEWIEKNCRHRDAGYTGGFDGWEPSACQDDACRADHPRPLPYRATEHNIDLVAAFERLRRATGDPKWTDRAEHARAFVEQMWAGDHFWTGTDGTNGGEEVKANPTCPTPPVVRTGERLLALGGDRINTDVVPLDVQAWAVSALGSPERFRAGLTYAESHLRAPDGGFAYSDKDTSGTWYEGTAQMAVAYTVLGRPVEAAKLLAVLEHGTLPSGAVPAAGKDGLDTGFFVASEPCPVKWLYYHRAHTGATAWAVLAERGVNPFAPVTPPPAAPAGAPGQR